MRYSITLLSKISWILKFDIQRPAERWRIEGRVDTDQSITSIVAPDWSAVEPMVLFVWLVEVGDAVNPGDRLAEIGIQGVSRDFESPAQGVVLQRLLPAGSSVTAGQVLLTLSPLTDLPDHSNP